MIYGTPCRLAVSILRAFQQLRTPNITAAYRGVDNMRVVPAACGPIDQLIARHFCQFQIFGHSACGQGRLPFAKLVNACNIKQVFCMILQICHLEAVSFFDFDFHIFCRICLFIVQIVACAVFHHFPGYLDGLIPSDCL